MQDTFKHQGLRRKLVEIIREKGIKDEKVLNAVGKIPRHLFMDNAFINFSYKGIDFGRLIYDHYIRNSGDPSPDKLNYKFLYFLNETLLIYLNVKKVFEENKFDYMVMSERQFIPSMIIFQIALSKKVKGWKMFLVRKIVK